MSRLSGSGLGTKEPKTTKASTPHQKEDLVSNLQSFRDEIRRRIEGETVHETGYSNVTAPKSPSDRPALSSLKNLKLFSSYQTENPGRSSHEPTLTQSIKESKKRLGISGDYLLQAGKSSPRAESPPKDLSAYISRNFNQTSYVRPNGISTTTRDSLDKRRESSPGKAQQYAIDFILC